MALSEELINKIKVLLYEDKRVEAEDILVSEAGLSAEESQEYVTRLKESLTNTKREGKSQSSRKLGIIITILGVLFISLAIYLAIIKKQDLENSVLTTGIVVGFSYDNTDAVWQDNRFDDEVTYAPIIIYEVAGKQYKKVSGVSSSPPTFELNEKVELYVNKDDPFDITINSFIDKWLVAVILSSLGFMFALIGVLIIIIKPTTSNSNGIALFEDDDEHLGALDD